VRRVAEPREDASGGRFGVFRIAGTLVLLVLLTAAAAIADPGGRGFGGRDGGPDRGDLRGLGGPPEFAPGPPGGPPHGPPPWEIGPRELERLSLTDAQRAGIERLCDEEQRALIRIDADARLAELDLGEAMRGDGADAASVESLARKLADLRGQELVAHVRRCLGVRRLLTAEQRARLRGIAAPPHARRP
jgi:Spy/CpxP family protein refolding chaperone